MILLYQQNERADLYQGITQSIVKAIEANPGKGEMPWHRDHGNNGLPSNPTTGRHYSGINVLTLWVQASERRYRTSHWATYRQWQDIGAQVQKGEKGTTVVFYKKLGGAQEELEAEINSKRPRYVMRASKVFNADQVEGYVPPEPKAKSLVEIIASAEQLISSTGADIQHSGDRAFYHRKEDRIWMPEKERFVGTQTSDPTESYYAVLLHELTHWTGHETRLNRDLSGRFGTESYAMEELIAEFGAAFLCADLGVTNGPRLDHAQYIANWLSVIKTDSRALFTAASTASEAATYLAAPPPTVIAPAAVELIELK
ncbi:MAG: DUF1738 domain-containing protein [Rhodospirillaceae bacterium]|nr:DUF1738 domain-containing protein [Rhodospirillaceae bacterium]